MKIVRSALLIGIACRGPGSDDAPPVDGVAPGDTTETGAPPGPTDTGEGPTEPLPPSYARDVAPIFGRLCVACHYPGSAGDYDLTDPFDPVSGFVGRPNSWVPNGADETVLIDPGNPDNSFLLLKIEEEVLDPKVDGSPMPYLPQVFSEAEIGLVEDWIRRGATDDAGFRADVAPLFGTEVTFRSASGRCTWCHYPGAPNGLSVIDPFDPTEGMVGRASRFGGLIVDPGDPEASVLIGKLRGTAPGDRMPQHLRRVEPDEVAAIRDWIARGAPND